MSTTRRNEDVDALASPTNPAHWYAYAAAGYLVTLSMPLLLFPRLLLILSTPRGAAGQAAIGTDAAQDAIAAIGPDLTPLERYNSYTNAIGMIAMAVLVLILTGAVPVSSSPIPDARSNGASPFRMPTLVVTTLYFAANALTAWTQAGNTAAAGAGAAAKQIDPSELGIGTYGKVIAMSHALFAFWGFAVFLFGQDVTRNAKKGGDTSAKDKSVSNWPFKNQYAAEEKSKKSS
ncbi:uncharacterized protein PFL1_03151 [Pseudozyma flocculosa PF-1]|uniref:Uncharacterized protein n=2 Tax=Pseudozyma flocculosa TaxID=84751 RepID=A0A5C3F2F7_9BASI|nr:uncharacterized protein PFL1_03151 [Pseudozyma flocculosa PF-1]EPQ29396.1 hypothetical protein PFL1_03151 [Pseudozyma flocculosa PF-1]SPO37917.1 uncharacterized protein PSFLO_03394 [Pseudozyma flocculosa]